MSESAPLSRLSAARHEARCRECRVTWLSWLLRLLNIKVGYTPARCFPAAYMPERVRLWSPWWLRHVLAVERASHEGTMDELRRAEAQR